MELGHVAEALTNATGGSWRLVEGHRDYRIVSSSGGKDYVVARCRRGADAVALFAGVCMLRQMVNRGGDR